LEEDVVIAGRWVRMETREAAMGRGTGDELPDALEIKAGEVL
jgi:hypothetical protein